jgi:hypothetical protein
MCSLYLDASTDAEMGVGDAEMGVRDESDSSKANKTLRL